MLKRAFSSKSKLQVSRFSAHCWAPLEASARGVEVQSLDSSVKDLQEIHQDLKTKAGFFALSRPLKELRW